MTYPLGFHRYSILFPISVIRKHPYLPNLVLFSLFSALYFAYLHYFEVEILHRNDYLFMIVSGITYLISVSNFVFDGPAIVYIGLSERFLSRVSCAAFYCCLSVFLTEGDYLSALLSVFFGAIALMTSVFARQLIMFTIPFLTIFYFSMTPLYILLISAALSLLISKKHFIRSMKHSTILYWKIYRTLNKKSSNVRLHLSRFISISFIINLLKERKYTSFLSELIRREPTRSLFFYPELILVIFFAFFALDNQMIRFLIPVITILIIYLLTSTERYNHLGESYRYIEYGLYYLLPLIIGLSSLTVLSKTGYSFMIGIVSLYGFFVIFISASYYYFSRKNISSDHSDHLASFLNNIPLKENDVVFPITMRLGADICTRAPCKSFWWQPGGITDPDLYQEFIEEYPYLRKNWGALFKKYQVTHVICDKIALKSISWQYDFTGLQLIKEDEYYKAYLVD